MELIRIVYIIAFLRIHELFKNL